MATATAFRFPPPPPPPPPPCVRDQRRRQPSEPAAATRLFPLELLSGERVALKTCAAAQRGGREEELPSLPSAVVAGCGGGSSSPPFPPALTLFPVSKSHRKTALAEAVTQLLESPVISHA